jgi:hypothetical protein
MVAAGNPHETTGLVTIAAGADEYVEMAKGLARSLEWAGMLCPRAVITNRADTDLHNFYHSVIVDRSLPNSYQAKLRVVDQSPYTSMVFIDVDCLVYDKFSLPTEPVEAPFVAFGEEVIDRDWAGVTREFVRSLKPGVDAYSIFHTGIFKARKCDTASAIFEQAFELEPLIQKNTGREGPVFDEVLISVSAALHGVTDFWPKDESLLSPATLWSSRPRLDIRRRTASTCCAGRWTSSRIVHFIHGFKDSPVYRRELKRLAALVPRCHLRTSALPDNAWSWRAVAAEKPQRFRWWLRMQGIE